jgi:hypothetical protein
MVAARSGRRFGRRLVVYTAIFGGYDALKQQPEIPGVEYVCFTDDRTLSAPGWRIARSRARYPHPRMSAKWFKLHPHRVLPWVGHSIYIDGSVQILGPDFFAVMLDALGDSGLALFRHPVRSTVRDEAAFCVPIEKYRRLPLIEQVEHYEAEGFRDDVGLYANGLIVRRHRTRAMRGLGRAWMRENERWTYQDQLSLPYLLWKRKIQPGVVPYALWDNPLFTLTAHTSER